MYFLYFLAFHEHNSLTFKHLLQAFISFYKRAKCIKSPMLAQLVEQSLPNPGFCGSNLVIDNFYMYCQLY